MKRPFGRGTTLLGGLINHGYEPLTKWDDPARYGNDWNPAPPTSRYEQWKNLVDCCIQGMILPSYMRLYDIIWDYNELFWGFLVTNQYNGKYEFFCFLWLICIKPCKIMDKQANYQPLTGVTQPWTIGLFLVEASFSQHVPEDRLHHEHLATN